MSSLLCAKNTKRFLRREVNTPVVFHNLRVKSIEPEPLPSSPGRRPTTKPKSPSPFFVNAKANLEVDEVQIDTNYVNSLTSIIIAPSKTSTLEVERKIIAQVESLSTDYLKFANEIISQIVQAHFSKFEDDGTNAQAIFRERTQLCNLLFQETQVKLDMYFASASSLGNTDGQSTLRLVLGSNPLKCAKVYRFKTAKVRQEMLHNGKTSYHRKYPIMVQMLDDRMEALKDKLDIAKDSWKQLGKHIEHSVLHRVAAILPKHDCDDDDESTDSGSRCNHIDIEADTMESELETMVKRALLSTFNLGYHFGYQNGQIRYKNHWNLSHNPWIYTLVTENSPDCLFLSRKPSIDPVSLKEQEHIDQKPNKRAKRIE